MSSDVANMIKEGMNDILLAQGQVQRRSSENVVLVDHKLCVRSEQLVSMGVALPVAIHRKRDEERRGFGGLGGHCSAARRERTGARRSRRSVFSLESRASASRQLTMEIRC